MMEYLVGAAVNPVDSLQNGADIAGEGINNFIAVALGDGIVATLSLLAAGACIVVLVRLVLRHGFNLGSKLVVLSFAAFFMLLFFLSFSKCSGQI
jgi:hypothetical protein